MRVNFRNAGAGLSGVNFMVAETGPLCLVENEGNGRMCTTAPNVHIAVTGIESDGWLPGEMSRARSVRY